MMRKSGKPDLQRRRAKNSPEAWAIATPMAWAWSRWKLVTSPAPFSCTIPTRIGQAPATTLRFGHAIALTQSRNEHLRWRLSRR